MVRISRQFIVVLLKLAVAVVVTGLLIHYASPSKIALALRSADIWLVLTFVPLTLTCMMLAALQLKILTDSHDMKLSLTQIVGINASTAFYSLFVPGILFGGVIRWYRLSQSNKMRAQALVVVVMNRLLSLFALLVIGVIGWLYTDDRANTEFFFWFILACLLAMIGGSAVLSNRQNAISIRRRIVDNDRMRPRIKEVLLKLIDAANDYRDIGLPNRLLLVLYAISWHLVVIAMTYFFGLALGVPIPLSVLAWTRAIVVLILLLPMTISGFGVREGSWVFLLGLYGVSPADAFALSLLTFVPTLFQAVVGFVLEMKTLFGFGNR